LTHVAPKIDKKIKGIEALCLKKKIFVDEFLSQYKDYNISKCIIEEPLAGSNNINTVATLLRFNGMISDSVYTVLGIVPEYISSYDARKYSYPNLMGIRKFDKKGNQYDTKKILKDISNDKLTLFSSFPWDIDKKTVMWNFITEDYPNIEWLYNNKGELRQENFDSTDACVAVKGYLNKIKSTDEHFKIVNQITENNIVEYTFTSPIGNITQKIIL